MAASVTRDVAGSLIDRRIDILREPDRHAGYGNLARAARQWGDTDAAARGLSHALVVAPSVPQLWFNRANLGLVAKSGGRPFRSLKRALLLEPAQAAALRSLAALGGARVSPHATRWLAWLSCVVVGDRTFAPRVDLLSLLLRLGRRREAEHRAMLLVRFAAGRGVLHELASAAASFEPRGGGLLARAALLQFPDLVRALVSLARIGLSAETPDSRAFTARRRWLAKAVSADPKYPRIYHAISQYAEQEGDAAASRRALMRALILRPGNDMVSFNHSVAMRSAGEFAAARRGLRRTVVTAPGADLYAYNLSLLDLAFGDAEAGLIGYERRWGAMQLEGGRRGGARPDLPLPAWDGTPLGEGKLAILGEQGLGDELWFAGYVPDVVAFQPCVLECHADLVEMFAGAMPSVEVVARTDPAHPSVRQARAQCAAGSLPYLLSRTGRRAATPAPFGYVDAPQPARRRGTGPNEIGRFIVGISWKSVKPDPSRSFGAPLAAWRPLLARGDLHLVSLQYGDVEDEIRELERRVGRTIGRLRREAGQGQVAALAAAVAGVDAVMTVANSTVSFAHALGKPCLVALKPDQDDWRYIKGAGRSPWLPTCRTFWLDGAGQWEGAIESMTAALGPAIS